MSVCARYPHTAGLLERYAQNIAAAIVGTRKMIVRREGAIAYDLLRDPDEQAPEPSTVADFEASKSGTKVQARDRTTGYPLWVVSVVDPDPEARDTSARVKVAAPVLPVLPESSNAPAVVKYRERLRKLYPAGPPTGRPSDYDLAGYGAARPFCGA